MVNKLLLPQEIETFYIIPTLRRHLAEGMKEQGMKQKDVAQIFMVNTATISQYNKKRGHQITFNLEVLGEIKKSAGLIKDHFTYLRETQRLLRYLRLTKILCQIHKQLSPVPEHCEPEETGCHPDPKAIGTCL